mmetsp:Transcript_105897/g.294684  ORF Transcript_105897/g.294684 Transcript_105897/m.294684 type:complete len:383 (-) Transcript_105897:159-1307(-)
MAAAEDLRAHEARGAHERRAPPVLLVLFVLLRLVRLWGRRLTPVVVGACARAGWQAHGGGQAEVRELGVVPLLFGSDQHVLGLQILEDDALSMKILQSEGHAGRVARGATLGQPLGPAAAGNHVAQDPLVQVDGAELHEDRVEGLCLEDVVEADDENMVGPVQCLGLPHCRLARLVLPLQLHGIHRPGLRVQDLDDLPKAPGAEGRQGLEGGQPHRMPAVTVPALLEELRKLLAHAAGKHRGCEAVSSLLRHPCPAQPSGPAAAAEGPVAAVALTATRQERPEERCAAVRRLQLLPSSGSAAVAGRALPLLLREHLRQLGQRISPQHLRGSLSPPVPLDHAQHAAAFRARAHSVRWPQERHGDLRAPAAAGQVQRNLTVCVC